MAHNDERESSLLEFARTKASVYGWTPDSVLTDIEIYDFFDSFFVAWCRTVKAELLPGLLRMMRESEGEAQLRASLLLLHLGEPVGTDGLIVCLGADDPQFRSTVLSSLSAMPLSVVKDSESNLLERPVPLKKEALLTALIPFIEHASGAEASRLESRSQFIALDIALKLDLPDLEPLVLPLLHQGQPRVRSRILRWLAGRNEDRGALDATSALLRDNVEVYAVISALEQYCGGDDSSLAQRAADLLVAYVRTNLARPGNDINNHLWHALDGIVAAQHPQRREVMQQVLSGPVKDWRRGVALQHLAVLEGAAGLPRLKLALADSDLRAFAADGIARWKARIDDPDMTDALLAAAKQESRPHVLGKLIRALLTVEADMSSLPLEIVERLGPTDAMTVHWLATGITPQIAADLLVEAGVIPAVTEAQLEELDEQWKRERMAHPVITSLLDKRMTWFDTESGLVTPDYLHLLVYFVTAGKPVFEAQSVRQIVDETTGNSEIRFIYNGRACAFTAQNYGDWYDMQSVLDGLNDVLADAGRMERFLPLYTGDQTAAVVFAPEGPFLEVARTLQLLLEQDRHAPMQRGVAFENQVMAEIKKQQKRDAHLQRASLLHGLVRRFLGRNGRGK